MKSVAYVLFGLFFVSAAQATCLGEAQIITRVLEARMKPAGTCTVTFDPYLTTHYAESGVCPLDMMDAFNAGITLKADGARCPYQPGDELSGVLVLRADGTIGLNE